MTDSQVADRRAAYAYALVVVLLWSTVASAFKIALRHLDFFQLLFWSSLTATLVLLSIVVVQGKLRFLLGCSALGWMSSAFLGLLNPFAYYLILFKAYSLLPAQQAQPLNFAWPVVLFSIVFLRQKIRTAGLLAILVSFTGLVVICTGGRLTTFHGTDPLGAGLAVGSSVLWALYWVMNVRDGRDDVVKLFLNFLFGFIFVLAYGAVQGRLAVPEARGLAGAAYVGLFEMGITFVLWQKALKHAANSAQVANLVYLSPFLSLVFIGTVVKERIMPSTVVGLGLIVAGIVVQQYVSRPVSQGGSGKSKE
jgi:drug/metabolite transporter (DMT)-like permease